MKSPFPGMDPYLEQRWRDVHTALAVYAADALHCQLPEDLVARIDYDDDGDSFVNRRVVVSETIRPERSVTVIEIISPLNKCVTEHCEAYRRRHAQAMSDQINVVEIDLVRSGKFDLIPRLERLEPRLGTIYAISIHRATRPGCAEIFPLRLRNCLPTIPIPLRPKDHDVTLNLQELIDQCYERGRHFKLDYRRPLDPPLNEDDAKWAADLIKAWRDGWQE